MEQTLHKTAFKHRFIIGSSKCTAKELLCLPTKILTTVRHGLGRYCNIKMSHNKSEQHVDYKELHQLSIIA